MIDIEFEDLKSLELTDCIYTLVEENLGHPTQRINIDKQNRIMNINPTYLIMGRESAGIDFVCHVHADGEYAHYNAGFNEGDYLGYEMEAVERGDRRDIVLTRDDVCDLDGCIDEYTFDSLMQSAREVAQMLTVECEERGCYLGKVALKYGRCKTNDIENPEYNQYVLTSVFSKGDITVLDRYGEELDFSQIHDMFVGQDLNEGDDYVANPQSSSK